MSMFSFSGGRTSDRISIIFDGDRPTKKMGKSDNLLPIFADDERVTGKVRINIDDGKKIEHQGIKIEILGQTEMFYDRGNYYEFCSAVRELSIPGVLTASKEYKFDFTAQKPFESYNGLNVRLRYFIRVTVSKNYSSNSVKEQDFIVQKLGKAPAPDSVVPIKMEVGIEECLHIEFEFDKQKYHLQDIIIGKVYFLLVRIKIKHMELNIIRREQAGSGQQQYNESETLVKYELMDGAPVRGECIPIRLFMSSLDLTPTYKNSSHKFSVKYYLNLVLVDAEDRRYFKQQEVILWRRDIG